MEKFYCRGDIIESLFKVKEYIEFKMFKNLSQKDFSYIMNMINHNIPKSIYFDTDIKELCEEVLGEIEQELYRNKTYIVEKLETMPMFNSNLVVLH